MKYVNLYRNYVIIGILSLIAVFFLPMLGTFIINENNEEMQVVFKLPETMAGWIVYLTSKISMVAINILIFDQFMKRAKINVQDNKYFKEAEEILMTKEDDEEIIMPAKYYINKMYCSKILTTILFTILGVFGFTNAFLTFDWVSMLSYTFTIIMALVFGWISMSEAEEIWIEKHYKYAKNFKRKQNTEQIFIKEQQNDKN